MAWPCISPAGCSPAAARALDSRRFSAYPWGMEIFTPLFQAVIAFVAVMTGLGFVFSLILAPVKESQAQLKESQADLKKSHAELKESHVELKEGHARLERRLDSLETDTKSQFREVNAKLDSLLAQSKK